MIRFFSPLNLTILALLALTTLAGFVLVPAGIALPVHWGVTGEADVTLPRDWALLQMPVVVAVVWAIFWGVDHWGGERREAAAAVLNVAVSAVTALMVLIQVLIVLIGLGYAVNVVQAVVAGVALLQIVLGNVMPKSRPNGAAGLRIPSTLRDPANWTATHRLTGMLTMVAGVLLLVTAFLVPVSLWLLAAVLASWIVPLGIGVAYSMSMARTHQA